MSNSGSDNGRMKITVPRPAMTFTIHYSPDFIKGVTYAFNEGPIIVKIVDDEKWFEHLKDKELKAIEIRGNLEEELLYRIEEFNEEKRQFLEERSKASVARKGARNARKMLIEAGMEMKCELCGYDKAVTIHHIDGNSFNNERKNLKVLCWNCHHGIEHGMGKNRKKGYWVVDPETKIQTWVTEE